MSYDSYISITNTSSKRTIYYAIQNVQKTIDPRLDAYFSISLSYSNPSKLIQGHNKYGWNAKKIVTTNYAGGTKNSAPENNHQYLAHSHKHMYVLDPNRYLPTNKATGCFRTNQMPAEHVWNVCQARTVAASS